MKRNRKTKINIIPKRKRPTKTKLCHPSDLFDVSQNLTDNSRSMHNIAAEPDYFKQFDPQKIDSVGFGPTNGVYQSIYSDDEDDQYRDIAIDNGYSDMRYDNSTYGITPPDQMYHTNMMPFFSAKNGYGSNDNLYTKQASYKNNLFSGDMDTYMDKREVRPLFSPESGKDNIHGMPVMSDYDRSRFQPSMYRQNDTPFDSIRVTPGVGLKHDEDGKHGFHPTYRPTLKTLEELRVNPKQSYKARIVHGMKGEKRPVTPNIVSHKPETFKRNHVDDMLPTSYYVDAPRTIDNHIVPESKKDCSHMEYTGAAHNPSQSLEKNVPEHMREKQRKSNKPTFKQPKPMQKYSADQTKYSGNKQAYIDDPTLKDQSLITGHIGGLGHHDRTYVYDDNPSATTNKETLVEHGPHTFVKSNTMYGTARNFEEIDATIKDINAEHRNNPQLSYLDRMPRVYGNQEIETTLKELSCSHNPLLTTNIEAYRSGHIASNYEAPGTTLREQNIYPRELPGSIQSSVYNRPLDIAEAPRTTLREDISQKTFNFMVNPIQYKNNNDPSLHNVMTTMKDTNIHVPYKNLGSNGDRIRSVNYDPLKTTTKESTIGQSRNTHITGSHRGSHINDHPIDTTTKETLLSLPSHHHITAINQHEGRRTHEPTRTTTRETTLSSPHHYVTGMNQNNGRRTHDPTRTTTRETTLAPSHHNLTGLNQRQKHQNMDPTNTTLKETILSSQKGNMTGINHRGAADTYNRDSTPATTKDQNIETKGVRNIYVGSGIRAQDDTPVKTTIKEQSIHVPYRQGISTGTKMRATDYQPTATTLKEFTIHDDRRGTAGLDNGNNGMGYLAENIEVDTTTKDMNINQNHVGSVKAGVRHIPYDAAYRMKLNDKKESVYREPTNSNVSLGPTMGAVETRIKDDNNISREPNMGYKFNYNDRTMGKISTKKTTYAIDDTINGCLVEQLSNNPYHIEYPRQ